MAGATGRPRVLVADHDEESLGLMALRLRRAGYDVEVAHDGEEALARVRERAPDVCVLDAMTPKLTGFEVVRRLREDARTCEVPVILLTALGRETIQREGFAGGVDAYVRKPCSPQELRTRVGAVLRRRRGAAARPGSS